MKKIVRDPSVIKLAHESILNTIKKCSEKKKFIVSRKHKETWWFSNFEFWYLQELKEEEKHFRNWLGTSLEQKHQDIQINISYSGNNRYSGVLLQDEFENIWIGHKGSGTSKKAGNINFLDDPEFSKYKEKVYYGKKTRNLLVIGKVGSYKFIEDIAEFAYTIHLYRVGLKTESSEHDFDFKKLIENAKTEEKRELLIRIGQDKYRKGLLEIWQNACSVTGCQIPEMLNASHAKPWKDCEIHEKLDLHNGLLLTPNLDRAFDRGFISFKDDGSIIISKKIKKDDEVLKKLGISNSMKISKVREGHRVYLKYHRENIFKK